MFGFPCGRCGRQEILHDELETLLGYFNSGRWPDLEYQEEPYLVDISTQEEFESFLASRLTRCRNFLLDGHSFQYRKKDEPNLVQLFATGGSRFAGFEPPHLTERVGRAAKRIARRREREAEKRFVQGFHPPVHTLIHFDGRRSFVAIGE